MTDGAAATAPASDAAIDSPAAHGRFRSLRFFSSAADEPRSRRPSDAALLIGVVLLTLPLLVIVEPDRPTGLGDDITGVMRGLPTVFVELWQIAYDLLFVWGAVLLIAVIAARGRLALLRDLVAASALAIVLGAFVGGLANADLSVTAGLFDQEPPPSFPALRLAAITALAVTASPHLSRPVRAVGRWTLFFGALAAIFVGVAFPSAAVIGFFVGVAAGAITHLVFGSPGGRPTRAQVSESLAGMGFDVREIDDVVWRDDGVAATTAGSADGRLYVKVYGRDAWNAQLLTGLWRFAWYRDPGSVNTVTRQQQVEHEGFVSLLAQRAGAPVQSVLAAGISVTRDALLVVRAKGDSLADRGDVGDDYLRALWRGVVDLHGAGVSHGRLDAETIRVIDDSPLLSDFAAATVAAPPSRLLTDRAQLLVATSLTVGAQRAIDAAEEVLGADQLSEVLPFLQRAALSRALRREVKQSDLDLEELRADVGQRTGVEEPELEKLHRVTVSSVLTSALLLVATWMLISGLADLGLDTIVDELRDATWAWLAIGLIIAQLPRVAQSFSTLGASPRPLPFGPVTALQFAVTFINLAIPSTAARLAVTVRFFQKLGVSANSALSMSALDSLAGLAVQITMIVGILAFGLVSLDLGIDIDEDKVLRLLGLVVVLAVVAVIVVLTVKSLRRRVVPQIREAVSVLSVLRSPAKALMLFGGNFAAQILFATAILCCLRAFGESASIAELVFVNTVVTTFAAIIPVPGGIGVSEAGLTAGLVAIGIPEAVAAATAITYRFLSFYLPPIWGWFCMRWLQRNDYL